MQDCDSSIIGFSVEGALLILIILIEKRIEIYLPFRRPRYAIAVSIVFPLITGTEGDTEDIP